jgi:flavin-dependent dehydrogenase
MGARLGQGGRVGIVGGGPAGSFAALHLLAMAGARGLALDVVIFEPHDPFSPPGPRSCKGCAGILSSGLVRNLAALGLTVPASVIQSELRSYVVHLFGQVASISQPDPARRILSVYRGSGPRLHAGAPLGSFDTFLLASACQRGARHVAGRVRRVAWEGGRPVIYADGQGHGLPVDLLVLATGVNSRPPLDESFGYLPPRTVLMVQDEIVRPADWPEDKVAGFFGQPPGLIFGAMVPKGAYLNVSLLWPDAGTDAIQRFYGAQRSDLLHFFPGGPHSACGCNPRIVVRPAPRPYGERWVAVGDAAVARLYKDGINSAFLTAQAAVRTALERGVEREDFAAGYAPHVRAVARDNLYGVLLYAVSAQLLKIPALARAWLVSMQAENSLPARLRLQSRIVWGLLTGDEPYSHLFWLVLRPRCLWRLARGLLAGLWRAPGAARAGGARAQTRAGATDRPSAPQHARANGGRP